MLWNPETSKEAFFKDQKMILDYTWMFKDIFTAFSTLCFRHLYKVDASFKTSCQVSVEKHWNTKIYY